MILAGGSDFYTLLREDPGLADVPVLFTGEEHQEWLLRGTDVLLSRRVEAPDLLDQIRRLLVSPFPPEGNVEREERFVRRRRMAMTK